MTTIKNNPTASPYEMRFNDKVFNVKPLTDKDSGELDNWVRDKFLLAAKQLAKLEDDSSAKKEYIRDALVMATRITWKYGEGLEIFFSEQGIPRLFWQGMVDKPNWQIFIQDYFLEASEEELQHNLDMYNINNPAFSIAVPDLEEEVESKGSVGN